MHLCLASLHLCTKAALPLCTISATWTPILVLGLCGPTVLRAICKRGEVPQHLAQGPDTLSFLVVQKSHHRGLECLVLHCVVEPVKLHLVFPRAQIS